MKTRKKNLQFTIRKEIILLKNGFLLNVTTKLLKYYRFSFKIHVYLLFKKYKYFIEKIHDVTLLFQIELF